MYVFGIIITHSFETRRKFNSIPSILPQHTHSLYILYAPPPLPHPPLATLTPTCHFEFQHSILFLFFLPCLIFLVARQINNTKAHASSPSVKLTHSWPSEFQNSVLVRMRGSGPVWIDRYGSARLLYVASAVKGELVGRVAATTL